MRRKFIQLALLSLWVWPVVAAAQDFKVFDRTVQVHGFASQGYIYTAGNNWLTMTTNGDGSPGLTEMGLNISTQVNDSFRVGAQVYDRNLGQLGQYHPQLDWLVVDYRLRQWFGIRAGKVKTTLGLYTDTQDLDFLHTFALMPQGVYPIDLRDTDIAHEGFDFYGNVPLLGKRGELSYTGYVGYRNDSIYSGYPYFLATLHVATKRSSGFQGGGDLRWATPLKGLLVGVSRLDEVVSSLGFRGGGEVREKTKDKPDFTDQFYAEYVWRRLSFDAEAKRFYRDHLVGNYLLEDALNVHAWYFSGSLRVNRRLELGSYYSHYTMTSTFLKIFNTSLPGAHDYDKVVTGKFTMNRYWIAKIEGHFMDGYAYGPYSNGFYPQQNPTFKPNTNALVVKTTVNF
jgi:hypothetical protein